MRQENQERLQTALLALVYVSVLGCLHKFDYNAALGMGMLYWYYLDRLLVQAAKTVSIAVGTTLAVDIGYISMAIYSAHKESDPYALSIRGLRIYSIVITLLEVGLKVLLILRLRIKRDVLSGQEAHNA